MSGTHPAFKTRFPPGRATFAGSLMLDIASGLHDRADMLERLHDLVPDDFANVYPKEPAPSLEAAIALLDEVIAEHDRVVTDVSPDTRRLLEGFTALGERHVEVSFGVGWDAREGAQDGYRVARHRPGAIGYSYATTQDLERVVLTGTLYLGFSSLAGGLGADSAAIGRIVADTMAGGGLPVIWNGDPHSRVMLTPIAFQRPFGR